MCRRMMTVPHFFVISDRKQRKKPIPVFVKLHNEYLKV